MLHIPRWPLGRNRLVIWRRVRYRRLVIGRWPNVREILVVMIGAVVLWGE